MRIRLLAVGTRMPDWVSQGVEEYRKRLPASLNFEVLELALGRRGKNPDLQRAIASEGEAMLAQIKPDHHVVALDVQGKPWSTEQLAGQLQNWQMQGGTVDLLVGGPDGLSADCLARAKQRWSLSAMTLPHPLVRIMLVEQLYRAWTINTHHPYHK